MCHSLCAKDGGHWKELVQDQGVAFHPEIRLRCPAPGNWVGWGGGHVCAHPGHHRPQDLSKGL